MTSSASGICSPSSLKLSIIRRHPQKGAEGGNPLLLTINGLTKAMGSSPSGCGSGGEHFFLVIGVDVTGTDPTGLIKVNMVQGSSLSGTGLTVGVGDKVLSQPGKCPL